MAQASVRTRRVSPPESRRPRKPAAVAVVPEWLWSAPWIAAAAVGIALVVFGPALKGSFVFDDIALPFANPKAAQQPAAFWIGGVRPVLVATYWANFLISGTDPFSYHLVNILLHAVTAVLVFFVIDRLLKIADVRDGGRWYALAGAALFLVHPLQTEAVDYIAGRSEVVSGFFLFAGWLVFLNHFESRTTVWTSVKILLLAGAAVLGKESAVSLPAILLATDLFFGEGFVRQFRKRLMLYVPLLCGAALGALVILRMLAGSSTAGFSFGVSPLQYALTQCRVILLYVRLFLVPLGQNGDWQLPFFHSVGRDLAWLWLLAILALIAAIIWLYPRARLLSFSLTLFLLMLAPTSSFVPVKDALAERRMYVPIVGLILAAVSLLVRSRPSPVRLRIVAFAAVALAGLLAWQRSAVWVSQIAFWSDVTGKNPANTRAHVALGGAFVEAGSYGDAVRELEIARAQDPKDQPALYSLATAYQLNRQPEKALSLFRAYAAARPTADVYDHVGFLEATLGHVTEAFDAFEKALKMDSNDGVAYSYRGTARLATNNAAGAEEDFRRALSIDPENKIARMGLDQVARNRR